MEGQMHGLNLYLILFTKGSCVSPKNPQNENRPNVLRSRGKI